MIDIIKMKGSGWRYISGKPDTEIKDEWHQST